MTVIKSREFIADRAWDAKEIACMNAISTRLHWTNQPCKWHVNDGEEHSTLPGIGEARVLVVETRLSV